MRGVLAVLVMLAGCAVIAGTLGYMSRSSPARGHELSPSDGRITALLARQQLSLEATTADRRQAARLARLALRQDPTAIPAVTTLGLEAQLRGDMVAARRLFAYAQQLSRRDFTTQLWAVEDAVGRGHVAQALAHYDIALRTTRTAPDVLFPILALANADEAVRAPLARILAHRPAWGEGFIGYLIDSGSDWPSIAKLFLSMRRLRATVPGDADAAVVSGLIAKGFLGDAWRYYAAIRPGADRRVSRDPRFVADLANPSLFDWNPINDAGAVTTIADGVADFAVSPNAGGSVLRQAQMLPPGAYMLDGHGSGIEQVEHAQLYWQLSCLDGRELGRVFVPVSGAAGSVFAGRLSVPSGCPVQVLTLIVRASDAVDTTGRIDRVLLQPAR